MKDDTRKAPIAKPTEERTSVQSTPSASGLTAGRAGVNPDRDERERTGDVAARTGRGEEVPRRYDEEVDEVMPSDDSSVNTKV
jgi:hypothetical protein